MATLIASLKQGDTVIWWKRIPAVWWIALAALAVVPANAQNAPPLPRWQPGRALASQLGAAVKVEGYGVRPPKGYQMQRGKAHEGVIGFAWVGAPRADGTRPMLMLGLITPPAGEAGKHTIEELADRLLAGVKRRRTHWQQGKPEKGLVNGMTFARIRWTGTEPTLQRQMQGFIYVALDGSTVIQLASQDVLPDAKQALPLAEAAVLTFKG